MHPSENVHVPVVRIDGGIWQKLRRKHRKYQFR
jgi:hypothetical protein